MDILREKTKGVECFSCSFVNMFMYSFVWCYELSYQLDVDLNLETKNADFYGFHAHIYLYTNAEAEHKPFLRAAHRVLMIIIDKSKLFFIKAKKNNILKVSRVRGNS